MRAPSSSARARRSLVLAALVVAAGGAGCLASSSEVLAPAGAEGALVLGADGAPLPFAAVTALGPAGPLRALAADGDGRLLPALLPPGTERVVVAAAGHAPVTLTTPLPAEIRLVAETAPPAVDDAAPLLRFLPPLDLGTAAFLHDSTCNANNCGLSEPVLEVAGDGSIYLSATCCIAKAPPVWVSRDGGATFAELPSLYREAVGIEGDFAVDEAGNVYFTDILLGAVWFTSWDADGNERWTLPVPFPPLVDRPWVRAGAEDVVYFAYNTAYDTLFYRSQDGGRTWEGPLLRAGFNLGDLGQGPERDHLYVVGGDRDLRLRESTDGGTTWAEAVEVPTPEGDGRVRDRSVPVADEAGNLWVTYAWGQEGVYGVYAVRRAPDGAWHGPFLVSPEGGTHAYPWPAALRDGTLAVAWYGAPWAEVEKGTATNGAPFWRVRDDDEYYLMVAVTLDGTSEAPSFQRVLADPEPVVKGELYRRLLDFVQIDVAPDGALHIGYAAERGGAHEHTFYVRSTTGLQLQPAVFPHGPTAGGGARSPSLLPDVLPPHRDA